MNELSQARIAHRWGFLEQDANPCGVVSARMEVLYLNGAARLIIPSDWFGRRCWQAFPVGDDRCASRCQAVWAVSHSDEITYCEEMIYPANGGPVLIGVAVIPLPEGQAEGERAILLLRAKPADASEELFKRPLLEDAQLLLSRASSQLKNGAD